MERSLSHASASSSSSEPEGFLGFLRGKAKGSLRREKSLTAAEPPAVLQTWANADFHFATNSVPLDNLQDTTFDLLPDVLLLRAREITARLFRRTASTSQFTPDGSREQTAEVADCGFGSDLGEAMDAGQDPQSSGLPAELVAQCSAAAGDDNCDGEDMDSSFSFSAARERSRAGHTVPEQSREALAAAALCGLPALAALFQKSLAEQQQLSQLDTQDSSARVAETTALPALPAVTSALAVTATLSSARRSEILPARQSTDKGMDVPATTAEQPLKLSDLPSSVLEHIFALGGLNTGSMIRERCQAIAVCRTWRRILRHPDYWRSVELDLNWFADNEALVKCLDSIARLHAPHLRSVVIGNYLQSYGCQLFAGDNIRAYDRTTEVLARFLRRVGTSLRSLVLVKCNASSRLLHVIGDACPMLEQLVFFCLPANVSIRTKDVRRVGRGCRRLRVLKVLVRASLHSALVNRQQWLDAAGARLPLAMYGEPVEVEPVVYPRGPASEGGRWANLFALWASNAQWLHLTGERWRGRIHMLHQCRFSSVFLLQSLPPGDAKLQAAAHDVIMRWCGAASPSAEAAMALGMPHLERLTVTRHRHFHSREFLPMWRADASAEIGAIVPDLIAEQVLSRVKSDFYHFLE